MPLQVLLVSFQVRLEELNILFQEIIWYKHLLISICFLILKGCYGQCYKNNEIIGTW